MRGLVTTIGFRLAIVALIAGGAFVFRDRLSGNAGDLAVGDCFDVPTTAAEEVDDVQHHPCTDSHTGEVIYVGDYPDAATFPTEAEWRSHFAARCVPAFNAYTGIDYTVDTVFTMGFFTPTPGGWDDGDREVSCYATRIDGAALTASIRKR